MASHQGQPAGQPAWARARLLRGSSAGAIWEITSDYPEARLSIGADASAGWAIVAHGVQPIHCELFWDGQSLWVADTHQVGGVFLDGERVCDWAQIRGPAELRFGQAALDFETSAATHEIMASNPSNARPITLTDMVAPPEDGRRSKPIFGGAASDTSIPDIESAATRVVASPTARDNDRTHVVPVGQVAAQDGPNMRPRLGGQGAPVSSTDATRMVPMPQQPAQVVTSPAGHAPKPVVAPPPEPPQAPLPEYVPTPFVEGGPSFVGPPSEARPIAPKPTPADILQKVVAFLKPETSAQVLEKSGGKKSQSLPARTWILLGITLAAAVGLLVWEEDPIEVPAPTTQGTGVTTVNVAPQPGPAVVPPPVPAPVVPPVVAPAPPVIAPVPSPPVAQGSPPTTEGEAPILTLQRQAADLYIAGSYAQALAVYRQLALAAPQEPSYASMVRILERRLAQQCRDGIGPGGEPCTMP